MATKKEISAYLKESGYTAKDMENFYNELIPINWKVRTLSTNGKKWNDLPIYLIRELPTQKECDLKAIKEKELKEEQERIAEQKAKEDAEYYANNFEQIMADKIARKEDLTEEELKTLVWEYQVDIQEKDSGRWTKHMRSIVELCGDLYSINFEQGLTECQENEYPYQPVKVKKVEITKTITVIEYVEV